MYRYLLGLMLGLVFVGCDSSKCKKFRTGIFIRTGDSLHLESKVIRTQEEQIVYNEAIGFRDEYKIKWTNDCQYYLLFQSSNRPEFIETTSTDTIFVKVIKVNPKSIRYRARIGNSEIEGEEFLVE